MAISLGVAVDGRRGVLLLVSVALGTAAVATAGTIGFVGLVAPHMARRLVAQLHQLLLPIAALIGGNTLTAKYQA